MMTLFRKKNGKKRETHFFEEKLCEGYQTHFKETKGQEKKVKTREMPRSSAWAAAAAVAAAATGFVVWQKMGYKLSWRSAWYTLSDLWPSLVHKKQWCVVIEDDGVDEDADAAVRRAEFAMELSKRGLRVLDLVESGCMRQGVTTVQLSKNLSPGCCAAYIALAIYRQCKALPPGVRIFDLIPAHNGQDTRLRGGGDACDQVRLYYHLPAVLQCPAAFDCVVNLLLKELKRVGCTVIVSFDKALIFATPLAALGRFRVACAKIADVHAVGRQMDESTIGEGASYNSSTNISLDVSALGPADTVVILHDVISTGTTHNTLEALVRKHVDASAGTIHSVALIDCSEPGNVRGLLKNAV